MSREEEFARNVCRALDQSVLRLDPVITERLRASRERALMRRPVRADAYVVSTEGALSLAGHHGSNGSHPIRSLLAILALLLGVSMAYYWNGFLQAGENEEIDSALLADDLPPNAYLDKGFQAWLEKDSSAGQ